MLPPAAASVAPCSGSSRGGGDDHGGRRPRECGGKAGLAEAVRMVIDWSMRPRDRGEGLLLTLQCVSCPHTGKVVGRSSSRRSWS